MLARLPPPPDFANTLHRLLVVDRVRPLRDVAKASGFSYPALYARMTGRVPFSADEIRRVLLEVPDIRLVDALLSGTCFAGFVRAPLAGGLAKRGAVGTAMHAMQQVARIAGDVAALVEDDALDAEALERLGQQILEAERSLAILRQALPHARRSQPQDAPSPAEPMPSAVAMPTQDPVMDSDARA